MFSIELYGYNEFAIWLDVSFNLAMAGLFIDGGPNTNGLFISVADAINTITLF